MYVGALATAIKDFKGGIFMISHNAEFYEALCPEKWILESGRVRPIHTYSHSMILTHRTYIRFVQLTVMGAEWMEEVEKARKKAEKLAKKTLDLSQAVEKKDALGNTIVEVLIS